MLTACPDGACFSSALEAAGAAGLLSLKKENLTGLTLSGTGVLVAGEEKLKGLAAGGGCASAGTGRGLTGTTGGGG